MALYTELHYLVQCAKTGHKVRSCINFSSTTAKQLSDNRHEPFLLNQCQQAQGFDLLGAECMHGRQTGFVKLAHRLLVDSTHIMQRHPSFHGWRRGHCCDIS